MKLLLDTHALVWAVMAPERLGVAARDAITATDSAVYASHVSLWEIAIKRRLGKMDEIDRPAAEWFETYVPKSHLVPLPINAQHLGAIEFLPMHHGDPFDRLLVAQARLGGLTIVTLDQQVTQYDVTVIW